MAARSSFFVLLVVASVALAEVCDPDIVSLTQDLPCYKQAVTDCQRALCYARVIFNRLRACNITTSDLTIAHYFRQLQVCDPFIMQCIDPTRPNLFDHIVAGSY